MFFGGCLAYDKVQFRFSFNVQLIHQICCQASAEMHPLGTRVLTLEEVSTGRFCLAAKCAIISYSASTLPNVIGIASTMLCNDMDACPRAGLQKRQNSQGRREVGGATGDHQAQVMALGHCNTGIYCRCCPVKYCTRSMGPDHTFQLQAVAGEEELSKAVLRNVYAGVPEKRKDAELLARYITR